MCLLLLILFASVFVCLHPLGWSMARMSVRAKVRAHVRVCVRPSSSGTQTRDAHEMYALSRMREMDASKIALRVFIYNRIYSTVLYIRLCDVAQSSELFCSCIWRRVR